MLHVGHFDVWEKGLGTGPVSLVSCQFHDPRPRGTGLVRSLSWAAMPKPSLTPEVQVLQLSVLFANEVWAGNGPIQRGTSLRDPKASVRTQVSLPPHSLGFPFPFHVEFSGLQLQTADM